MTSQRIGKYACLEVECRYMLNKLPDELLENPQGWLITDRYLPNTHLRLRHIKSVTGEENIYKLTQKYRSEIKAHTKLRLPIYTLPKQNITTSKP